MITDEEIEKLNFYGWSDAGMTENPKDVPIEDVFVLKSDVIELLQQNKVSDVSAEDNELEFWKNKARIASNEYLQVSEALNILQKHSPDFDDESGLYYRGDSVLKIMAEYAYIVNERKDNVESDESQQTNK